MNARSPSAQLVVFVLVRIAIDVVAQVLGLVIRISIIGSIVVTLIVGGVMGLTGEADLVPRSRRRRTEQADDAMPQRRRRPKWMQAQTLLVDSPLVCALLDPIRTTLRRAHGARPGSGTGESADPHVSVMTEMARITDRVNQSVGAVRGRFGRPVWERNMRAYQLRITA